MPRPGVVAGDRDFGGARAVHLDRRGRRGGAAGPARTSLCGWKLASITMSPAWAASAHISSIDAPPSRRDQARSTSPSPGTCRASCSVSLTRSFVTSEYPSSAARGKARLVFPAPSFPDTYTSLRIPALSGIHVPSHHSQRSVVSLVNRWRPLGRAGTIAACLLHTSARRPLRTPTASAWPTSGHGNLPTGARCPRTTSTGSTRRSAPRRGGASWQRPSRHGAGFLPR